MEVLTDDEIAAATGSDYCYAYRELPIQATVEQVRQYCRQARKLFAPIARAFTPEDNVHWVLRHYLAIKLATAAALLAGSAEYSFDRNLLTAVPYFNYYAVLNACQAYLLTSPHVPTGFCHVGQLSFHRSACPDAQHTGSQAP
jgi:hypothetical protein